MSRTMRDISFFLFKVILTCAIVIAILRVYVWYNNKPLDTFVNILFYLALFFLIMGFLSILITFLKSTFINNNSYADNFVQIEQENYSYKNILNFTTLLILDGIVFILLSFFLTFIISYLTSAMIY